MEESPVRSELRAKLNDRALVANLTAALATREAELNHAQVDNILFAWQVKSWGLAMRDAKDRARDVRAGLVSNHLDSLPDGIRLLSHLRERNALAELMACVAAPTSIP